MEVKQRKKDIGKVARQVCVNSRLLLRTGGGGGQTGISEVPIVGTIKNTKFLELENN